MQTDGDWCCEVQVAIIESSMVNERGGIVMNSKFIYRSVVS